MADYTPKATITLKSKASLSTTSLDQKRAAYAWECAQNVPNVPNDYDKLAKAAPALIMNNGLMQALAYYQDKGKDHHLALSKHVREWLKSRFSNRFTSSDYRDIMQGLFTTPDASFYRQATEETLALLRWIRQFAAARASG